jgi:hypothetical protein
MYVFKSIKYGAYSTLWPSGSNPIPFGFCNRIPFGGAAIRRRRIADWFMEGIYNDPCDDPGMSQFAAEWPIHEELFQPEDSQQTEAFPPADDSQVPFSQIDRTDFAEDVSHSENIDPNCTQTSTPCHSPCRPSQAKRRRSDTFDVRARQADHIEALAFAKRASWPPEEVKFYDKECLHGRCWTRKQLSEHSLFKEEIDGLSLPTLTSHTIDARNNHAFGLILASKKGKALLQNPSGKCQEKRDIANLAKLYPFHPAYLEGDKMCRRELMRQWWTGLDSHERSGYLHLVGTFLGIETDDMVKNAIQSEAGLPLEGHSVLLTYNGPWHRDPEFERSLPPHWDIEPFRNIIETYTEIFRNSKVFKRLVRDIMKLGEMALADGRCDQWTGAIELCPESEEAGRIHVHVFLSNRHVRNKKYTWAPKRYFAIGGVCPSHGSNNWSKRGSRWSHQSIQQGHSYLQMVFKVGHVWCESNAWQPFNGRAAISWWQQNKIHSLPLIKQMKIHRAPLSRIQEVKGHLLLEKEERMDRIYLQNEAKYREMDGAFPTIAQVTAWQEQYKYWNPSAKVKRRYKFLVLTGRSSTGKSCFAKSLFKSVADFLQVGCICDTMPCLKDFESEENPKVGIIFDEATAKMVVKVRQFFQGGNDKVQLAQSATNVAAYKVNVHGTPLILTSNTWEEECLELRKGDQEWLATNSVVLKVVGPLWEPNAVLSN